VRDRRFPALDSLRAIAALSILAYHAVGFYARGAGEETLIGPYVARLDVGVTLFFLLSGFLLYRPFVQARRDGLPQPRLLPYAWRRGCWPRPSPRMRPGRRLEPQRRALDREPAQRREGDGPRQPRSRPQEVRVDVRLPAAQALVGEQLQERQVVEEDAVGDDPEPAQRRPDQEGADDARADDGR